MSQMFQHRHAVHCVDAPGEKKKKRIQYDLFCHLVYLFSVKIVINEIINCIRRIYTRIVAILHIEIFVIFDFYPSLTSWWITGSYLDPVRFIFGHKLMDNWATELYKSHC